MYGHQQKLKKEIQKIKLVMLGVHLQMTEVLYKLVLNFGMIIH